MNDDLILNVAYFCAALCIVYKVAWIARMTGHIALWQVHGLRLAGALYAFIVLGRAALRFVDAGDPATLIDVARELSMCVFLFFSIVVLRIRTGRW